VRLLKSCITGDEATLEPLFLRELLEVLQYPNPFPSAFKLLLLPFPLSTIFLVLACSTTCVFLSSSMSFHKYVGLGGRLTNLGGRGGGGDDSTSSGPSAAGRIKSGFVSVGEGRSGRTFWW
jgi:hypothetical protein